MSDAPPTVAEQPRRGRRVWRWLGIAGAVVVAIVVIAVAALHTSPARRFVLRQIGEILAAQQIDLQAESLDYNLLDLSIDLSGATVRSARAPEAPPFATIARATLDLRLLALLRGRYVVESGRVEGLDVHYYVNAEGEDNVPRPPSDPDAPSEPIDYLIEDMEVASSRVRYEHRPQELDVQLPVSSLTIDGTDLTDRHDIQLQAGDGTLRVQDRSTAIARLSAALELGDDDLVVESLDLEVDGLSAALEGGLENFDDPALDLTLNARVDTARAAALAGVNERVGGTLQIDATAEGTIAALVLEAALSGSELRFRSLDGAALSGTAAYDLGEARARVSSLTLRAPWGEIAADGTIATEASAPSRLQLTIASLDAGAVMRALDTPHRLATRVDARVDARWPGLDYLAATGEATATLTATASRVTAQATPLAGRLRVNATDGRVRAQLTDVRAAGATVDGRVSLVDRQQVDGRLTARVGDLARLVAAGEALLGRPRGSLLPVPVAGPMTARADLGGTLQVPNVAASVQSPGLQVGEASAIAVDGQVVYDPAAVRVDRLALSWRQAQASLTGRVGLQGAQRLDLAFAADALAVSELLSAAGQSGVPASGQLSLHGQIAGTVARPAGSVTVSGSDLAAYDEALGALTGRVNLDGREIRLETLVLDKPQPDRNGRLSVTGIYDLDRRAYTFALDTTNLRVLGATLPNGQTLRADVQLHATGAGSIAQPAAEVDLIAEALRVGDYDLGRIVLDASVAGDGATLDVAAPQFGVTADARVGIESPYSTTATVRVDALDLAALPVRLETPLDGSLRATVDASGTLAAPAEGRATAVIREFAGSWHGQPFRVEAPATIRYASERVAIDDLRLTARDSTLALEGELPLTTEAGEGTLTLDVQANLATLALYAPSGMDLSADGRLALAGTLQGTRRSVRPDLTLTVSDGLILTPAIEPGLSRLTLRARVDGGNAFVDELGANWGAARLDASARVPLQILPELPVGLPPGDGPASATATVTDLNPGALPGAPEGLTGMISLTARAEAESADLGALSGEVTFPDLQVGFNGLTLAQQQPSRIGLEDGSAVIDQFTLSGSAGTIAAVGRVGLAGARDLAVDVNGTLNIAAISAFTDALRAEGESTIAIAARGTVAEPDLSGAVTLADGTVLVDEPRIAAEGLDARIDLDGRRLTLSRLDGDINGGTLEGSGTVTLGEGGLADIDLRLATNDFAFDAPLDLRSLSDTTLTITSSGEQILIDGQVTIEEAGLTGDINFDTGLLAAIAARPELDLTEERNPLLERTRFNIQVDTATPILVDNNIALAEVTTNLRVLGTPYETGMSGRLTVAEGSEITLNERRYEVQRGVITFTDERRISPSFDLLLTTAARNYDITLAVSGEPGDTETVLTSNPALPEPDIMAMLVTGRTLDEMRGEEYEVAREQVLSYLTGRVGSSLGRGLERATGLSEVRIEPNLIANEADPSARLTVGQNLTDDLKLVYSTDLANSNDQIWIAEYDVTRRFQTQAVRQRDNSYRFDFRHDVRFGGRPAPRRMPRERPELAVVNIAGDDVASEAQLRELLGAEIGEPYDFFAVRQGAERVREFYRSRNRLQSRVRVEREVDGDRAILTLRTSPGPIVNLEYECVTPPEKVREDVALQWHQGVFDAQRADDALEALRAWLMDDQHLRPNLEYRIDEVGPDQRRVTFVVDPGTRFDQVVLVFEGASAIDPDELDDIIDEQDLERSLFVDPVVVTELLERFYREQGYLGVEIAEPRYEYEGTVARIIVPVDEGPRFTVRHVSATGNTVYPTPALVDALPVVPGDPFLPAAAENALNKIRDLYWDRAYNDVRSEYSLAVDRAAAVVDVRFAIEEGRQSVLAGITIDGNDQTSDRLVREQIELQPSEPLKLSALGRSRRNLYATGAYSVVDITREELNGGDAPSNGATASADAWSDQADGVAPDAQPVRLDVKLREVQPFQVQYGASYDTERGVGGILDVSNRNSLGKARVLGLHSRYDSQIREGRMYLSQPALVYWPLQTTASVYIREENNPATDVNDAFDVDLWGASIQQELKLRDAYVWNLGYRFERASATDPVPGGQAGEAISVAPLTSTLTRETRDDVLDASRGSFLSHALSYSPGWLGSDLPFVRYYGQYFYYIPLEPPTRVRFTNEILRPRLVFATGVRLGLARGFGGAVPFSERFFAGGSTTLRGFEQNAVGPIGTDRRPIGGNALFILNNELRFPIVGIVDGVGFLDVGNVFRNVSDFSLTDLREAAGVGVRLRTPWFLIRGDYGFALDARPGERKSRFFFSIGQAF